MRYEKQIKIRALINSALPKEKKPKLTPEQIEKLKNAAEITLAILGGLGIVALTLVAPNVIYAVGKILETEIGRKPTRKDIQNRVARTFYYLKQHDLIKLKPTAGDLKIYLTKFGRSKLRDIGFENLTIDKPRRWNKKWWQVAADIPTKEHKNDADEFRDKLKDMGFYPLQRTLWFYPFDPRKELESVLRRYDIGRFVTVMEVNRLDKSDEKIMKKYFRSQKII